MVQGNGDIDAVKLPHDGSSPMIAAPKQAFKLQVGRLTKFLVLHDRNYQAAKVVHVGQSEKLALGPGAPPRDVQRMVGDHEGSQW